MRNIPLFMKYTPKLSPDKLFTQFKEKKSDFWKKQSIQTLQEVFLSSKKNVPAYAAFLKKNGYSGKNVDDAPSINKNNYLRAYEWEELCSKQALAHDSLVLTSTSGSTGEPFYFPRNGAIDFQASIYHELFVRNARIDPKKSTLVIVCFGMGVWIGGVITYEAFKQISERGYGMTILTPGVNKKEIFEAMKNVAPHYDQVILCGYPPFVKDVLDEGEANGVIWSKHDMRIIFAAEAFSEKFRDYIAKKAGLKNIYRDTMNIYGSADIGTMAEESPLSILIRRLALKNKKLYNKLFVDSTRLPTLAQYIPHFITFEEKNKHIYLTGDNAMPLVRYEIGDNGGVMTYAEVEKIFKSEGMDVRAEAKKAGILDSVAELPFLYIYERTDLSTKLYGAIIYPEYVKTALLHPEVQKHLTGKFTMLTKNDVKQDEYLEINLELKPESAETDELAKEIAKHIVEELLEHSAEYTYLTSMLGERVKPRAVLWHHEHPLHFRVGIKQKWVKKG